MAHLPASPRVILTHKSASASIINNTVVVNAGFFSALTAFIRPATGRGKMSLRKWICFALLYSFITITPAASTPDSTPGEMRLNGEIIEAACEIEFQDREQWIEFGQITAHEILSRSGNNLTHAFHIRLTDCSLQSQIYPGLYYRSAKITFNSDKVREGNELIGITGDAKGFGIRLSDANGKRVRLGVPTSDFPLNDGVNTLNFKATIVPLSSNILSGEFYATVRFFMDYF
ncbi:fimbrial protein [Erwinia sp. SLM-02]|uniref:fimbrial protein n=1 Tax=Erwinia sp. SLM-02 TaxID=3020057 RepID=UPI0030807E06